MNVANLELCKELYGLSGWDDTSAAYYDDGDETWSEDRRYADEYGREPKYPAYTAGYLLRKLPGVKLEQIDKEYWDAQKMYNDGTELPNYKTCSADTPEEALASLAIELFKSGVLKK